MRSESSKESQRPPGVFATLSAGFELTTRSLWLILIPLILDVFFWLGPRLSIEDMVISLMSSLNEGTEFANMVDLLVQNAARTNLFTLLSVPIIGIPALMRGLVPEETPLESPVIQIGGPFSWLILFVIMSLLGIILSTVYFGLICQAIRGKDGQPTAKLGGFIHSLVINTARLTGLGLIFLFAMLIVMIPMLPIVLFFSMATGGFMTGVLLLGSAFVIVYFSMSLPAIIFSDRSIMRAIRESFRLVHKNILPTVNLLLLIWLITAGINILWHKADNGSWLTFISLTGHAFISTALFTALFLFYRDRSMEQINTVNY